MRPKRQSNLLLLLVILPAIGIYLQQGGGPAWKAGVQLAFAQAGSETERFAQAQEWFEDSRYRDALDLLEMMDAAPVGVDPRQFAFLRGATFLRQSKFETFDLAQRTKVIAGLVTLIADRDDEWAARSYAELIRAREFSAAGQWREQSLVYWERQTDVNRAALGYIDLARAHMEVQGAGDTSLFLRIWENLIISEVAADQVIDLGVEILGFDRNPTASTFESMWWRHHAMANRVAVDLLGFELEPWIEAQALVVRGRVAESEGDFVTAIEIYERAVSLIKSIDSSASAAAGRRIRELADPSLDLQVAKVFRPGSGHRFELQWRNLAAWRLELRKIDPRSDLIDLQKWNQPRDLDDVVQLDRGTRVHRREVDDTLEQASRREGGSRLERHQPRHETVWIDPLEPGVYVAEFSAETFDGAVTPAPQRHVFMVSALGVFERAVHDATTDRSVRELWILRMDDGEPIASIDLDLFEGFTRPSSENRRTLRWSTRELESGADGRCRYPLGNNPASILFVRGEHDGQPLLFLASASGENWIPSGEQPRGLVWTDRPLYRPGETVNLQAFFRSLDVISRDLTIPRLDNLMLMVNGPDGESIVERPVQLEANGSLVSSFDLPQLAALGAYSISVRASDHRYALHASFEVDEVRLPEFTVAVTLDEDRRFVLGDTLEVEVSAEYLFGGAVDGRAEVVVHQAPVWNIWRPWVRMPWIFENESVGFGRGILPYPGRGGGQEVLRREVVLEDGVAKLKIPTQRSDLDTHSMRYTVEVRVVDASRREESGSAVITVGRTELTAFLSSVRHVVAPGDRAEVTLRIQDAMGRGVEHAGTWELRRIGKNGRERSLLQREVRTGADGLATLSFTPEREGHYRVLVRGVDGRGHELVAETVVWVADPSTQQLPAVDQAVTIIVEQPEFLGDTARALLLCDTPGASILFTRTHAGGSEVEVVRMTGTAKLIEIELDARHRPSFELQAMRVRDYRMHTASERLVVPLASSLLDISMEFDHETYEPGAHAPLRVRVTDAHGNPVSTVFALSVVDEALLSIAPRHDLDPVRSLYQVPLASTAMPRLMVNYGGYTLEQEGDEVEEDQLIGRSAGRRQERGRMYKSSDGLAMAEGAVMESSFADAMAPSPMLATDAPASFTPKSVRSDFRTTALWRVGIVTDENGLATVDVPLAESLTRWNAFALALDPQSRAGIGEATVRTRKPVMARLQHPRVFRESDRFLMAAIIHNETDEAIDAIVQLEAAALFEGARTQRIFVEAGAQGRAEWEVEVPESMVQATFVRDDHGRIVGVIPAEIDVQLAVQSSMGEDALRRKVRLIPFGTGLHMASTIELDPGSGQLRLEAIEDRAPGSETVTLSVAPSMLSACVDALPSLAKFPYGCTEQTLSRFVPAVAVRTVARAIGVKASRIDPELDAKIALGLKKIASMQDSGGGWGWWSGAHADPYITSYAVMALSRARIDGVSVNRSMLTRGRDALRSMLTDIERRPDDLAYALFALAQADEALNGDHRARGDEAMRRWAEQLFEDRDDLSAYARALLARVLMRYDSQSDAVLLLRHLHNDVRIDTTVDTAHWGETRGYYWRGQGAVESTAFVLQAFVEIDPDHPLRAQAARWLVLNRRGNQWDSTRSSAHAIYALCDHLQDSDELRPDYTLTVSQRGETLLTIEIAPSDLIDGGGRFELPASVLDHGALELHLEGKGRAYLTLEADAFSRAREIEPAGHIVEITREVVRLRPRRTLGAGVVNFEEAIDASSRLDSGERMLVRLHITAHHDVDYVMIEDPRAAGFEPLERSGWFGSHGLSGRREVRDDRTAFFVSHLREGEHVIEYELRAESPGSYHVAPARVLAMYLPDVTGHSAHEDLVVQARPEPSQQGR